MELNKKEEESILRSIISLVKTYPSNEPESLHNQGLGKIEQMGTAQVFIEDEDEKIKKDTKNDKRPILLNKLN